ncbi:hypothetical protein KL86PLE_100045 [uncultured Pleomorphomonas sp.]|uniref:Uncharacterized protein n=1 Tax=uncultured Pleomorphomonas sp. TaxID=442121 RepID=A0A212L0X9_9HYPH|nr:hypothetical protein KL86PLE_100045 [uncultured Pleomorphomonas sp.]
MRSMSSPSAVSIRIGVLPAARRRRQMLKPSSPGSMASSTMRSAPRRSSSRFISPPEMATDAWKPLSVISSTSICAMSASSSTMTMCGAAERSVNVLAGMAAMSGLWFVGWGYYARPGTYYQTTPPSVIFCYVAPPDTGGGPRRLPRNKSKHFKILKNIRRP